MKKLPIGLQTFEKIIKGNYIYVDKTKFIYDLVQQGSYHFLSRPRRFGKSLLLSTLKSYFEGKKELFKGLYISKKEKEWKLHPVININFSTIEYRSGKKAFEESLIFQLDSISKEYDIILEGKLLADRFKNLIEQLFNKVGQVVILVDEYDKPLVDSLTNEEQFEENRLILNGFYGSMKGLDAQLRFVFLTGVSRFAKVGVFSGLNNLDDISLETNYNSVLGFTQGEVLINFQPYIELLKNKFQLTEKALFEYIQFWYNGFSWDGQQRLYNPFSILNLFKKQIFDNYWFSTGTPTFLIDLIKKQQELPDTLEGVMLSDLSGSSMNYQNFPLYPLLFQTGYLTIEAIIPDGVTSYYKLNYPNEEVRHSFIMHILASFAEKDESKIQPETIALKKALYEENTDQFVSILTSFFADIPSRLHIQKEAYYHSLVYMLLRLVGVKLLLEKETDKGRIDGVLELADKVYVIEFKFATNKRIKNIKTLTRKAITQIEDNKYYEPWLNNSKKIILFGLGFLDKKIDGKMKVIS